MPMHAHAMSASTLSRGRARVQAGSVTSRVNTLVDNYSFHFSEEQHLNQSGQSRDLEQTGPVGAALPN